MFAAVALYISLAVAADGEPEYKIHRAIPENKPVTSGRDIVQLALKDLESLTPDEQVLARYVWVPDWVEPKSGFGQVSLVANSTFSRTSNVIQPASLADGRLLRLDLVKYAASAEQVIEIRNLYELLSQSDSFFNVEVKLHEDVAVVVESNPKSGTEVDLKLQSGQWTSAKFVSRSGDNVVVELSGKNYTVSADKVRAKNSQSEKPAHARDTTFAAAAYLYPEGARLFELTQSFIPIMRLDEWVAFSFSSINGGKYYELAGIEKTLEDTIKKFAGKDASDKVVRFSEAVRRAQAESQKTGEHIVQALSRLDPELAKTKAYIEESGVTGRQRLVLFIYGAATAPAQGPQIIAITFDIGEENTDPNNDPLRGPTRFERYDGGEVIFSLPNGLLAYFVFNNKDQVIASVPDNVAFDHSAREVRSNVATARVFSGVSCAHCHDNTATNWGWQTVSNDLPVSPEGLTRLADDRSQGDPARAQQIAASQFGQKNEDLKAMLTQSRVSYQFRAQLATNQKTTRETVFGLSDSYWGYWYDYVTPSIAARDLGQALSEKNAQLFLLRAIDPETDKIDGVSLREDVVLARLKEGKKVSPAQWRAGFQSFAERANFHILEAPSGSK